MTISLYLREEFSNKSQDSNLFNGLSDNQKSALIEKLYDIATDRNFQPLINASYSGIFDELSNDKRINLIIKLANNNSEYINAISNSFKIGLFSNMSAENRINVVSYLGGSLVKATQLERLDILSNAIAEGRLNGLNGHVKANAIMIALSNSAYPVEDLEPISDIFKRTNFHLSDKDKIEFLNAYFDKDLVEIMKLMNKGLVKSEITQLSDLNRSNIKSKN